MRIAAGPGSALVCTLTSERRGLSCLTERTCRPAASCTSARAAAGANASDTTTATSPHPRTPHHDSWEALGPLQAGLTGRRGLGQRRDERQRHADLLAAEQPAHAVDAGAADIALLADDLADAQARVVGRRQRAGRAALRAA